MITIDKLIKFGVDPEEGLKRCMDNESFYLMLVAKVPDDKGFDNLKEAIDAGDLKAGFEAAHALKGVLGNLSLTSMYGPVSKITELLRSGTEMDYSPLVAEILDMRDTLKELCE